MSHDSWRRNGTASLGGRLHGVALRVGWRGLGAFLLQLPGGAGLALRRRGLPGWAPQGGPLQAWTLGSSQWEGAARAPRGKLAPSPACSQGDLPLADRPLQTQSA